MKKYGLIGFFPAVGWAQSQSGVSAVNAVEPMSVVMALLLVVLLIVALGWLLKRSGVAGLAAGGPMKVIASVPLGGRERAVLVQVGEQQLLLGVAPGQVRLLHQLETPISQTPAVQGEFAARLRQLLEPGKKS